MTHYMIYFTPSTVVLQLSNGPRTAAPHSPGPSPSLRALLRLMSISSETSLCIFSHTTAFNLFAAESFLWYQVPQRPGFSGRFNGYSGLTRFRVTGAYDKTLRVFSNTTFQRNSSALSLHGLTQLVVSKCLNILLH